MTEMKENPLCSFHHIERIRALEEHRANLVSLFDLSLKIQKPLKHPSAA